VEDESGCDGIEHRRDGHLIGKVGRIGSLQLNLVL